MYLKRISWMLVAGLLSTSCGLITTQKEGDALRRDVIDMQARLESLEKAASQNREQLMELIERARTEMENLQITLRKATAVLARNSADFGAEMETVEDRIRVLEGTLAELDHKVGETDKKMDATNRKVYGFAMAAGLDLPVDESKIPKGESAHFKEINKSYDALRYGEARSLCKIFFERYRGSKRADDVQLMVAQSYMAQKRWAKSLGALKQFTDTYPKSDLTAEVYFSTARAFFMLGDCTDARLLCEAITSKFPRSPFAKKASALVGEMNVKKARCTS